MFVAVMPPQDVVEDLAEFLEPRRLADLDSDRPLRWTLPEQWHVTLAFLAHVPERSLDDLGERLARAAARRTSFALEFGGGGAFPSAARAKLLYAGVHGSDEALTELHRLSDGARAAANRAGAPADGGHFRPHLTLARSNRPQEATRWLRILDTWRSRPVPVDEIHLVQSFLGEGPRNRPRYETVGTFALGRGSGVRSEAIDAGGGS